MNKYSISELTTLNYQYYLNNDMRIYKLSVELEVDQSVFAIECNIVKKQIKDLDFCVLLNLACILLLTLTVFSSP